MASTPLDPAKRPRTRASAPLLAEQDDNWRFYVPRTPAQVLKMNQSAASGDEVPQSFALVARASPELQAPREQGEVSRASSSKRRAYPTYIIGASLSLCSTATEVASTLPTPPATPLVVAVASPSSTSVATREEGMIQRTLDSDLDSSG